MDERTKYLSLLSDKYPTIRSLSREIINLSAILNLPKGTEHFMSDIHGEYEAFCHILNNCSGVIKEKTDLIYRDVLSHEERKDICTLIYYPKEKLSLIKKEGTISVERYRDMITRLIEIARALSSKYTRSKVRKAMPEDYAYILDELLYAQKDEDDNQIRYHRKILDTIIKIEADDFITSLSSLIKRLAVDRLHIVGDIFDRGESADRIIDLLSEYHSLDIEWGNHDILWMGAGAGDFTCIANVVRNCIKYHTESTLENGYGVSLRSLMLFSERTYQNENITDAMLSAISVILFKTEGQVILRHREYEMDDRLLLHRIDTESKTVKINDVTYPINTADFPTVDRENPYALSNEEQRILNELKEAFTNSERLRKHIRFLYEKGSMARCYNENLLYHGCVPMTEDGEFDEVELFGKFYKGKALFDIADKKAREAFFSKEKSIENLDFMWYLWHGRKSPLCGRNIKLFERTYIDDKAAWEEEKNPYYRLYYQEKICQKILSEFSLSSPCSHIINGHTPVKTVKGELPVRAHGRLFVIDGGFCEKYHETTGIAGYTLIYNSHGLRLKAHRPFESIEKALLENKDIHSSSEIVETESRRVMVEDTDDGKRIKEEIKDLYDLLTLYRSGVLRQK